MEKSNVRSLPPLVQGKLAGVFEFAVEEIKITEKIFKNKNLSLLVKVLWWGETKPLFIRPNKIHFITKDNNEVTINEPGGNSVKYEVHTNLKLFKSYLEKCEVVELVILNSLQNEVIGSTFLHDLIHLVFYSQLFNSSVINHSGDPIGEISCQLSFKEVNIKKSFEGIESNAKVSPVKKWSASDLKVNLNTLNLNSPSSIIDKGSELNKGNNSDRVFHEFPNSSKNVVDDLSSQRSSNLHYNSPVAQNFGLKVDSKCPDTPEYSDKKTELINDHVTNSSIIHVNSKEAINLHLPVDSERSKKTLLVDSSDIVCKANSVELPNHKQVNVKDKKRFMNKSKNTYLVNRKQEENVNKNRNCSIAQSAKITNKKTVTSKVKSYIENKAQKNKSICAEKAFVGSKKNQQSIAAFSIGTGNQKVGKTTNGIVKPTKNIKSITKVSKEISKLSKLHLNPPKDLKDEHSDLEKVPVKEDIPSNNAQKHVPSETINEKGIDNEKININESCGKYKTNNKDYKSEQFEQKEKSEYSQNLQTVNVDNKMHYDLNDPIEKIYYETFFLKTGNVCNNEFEIAELLNQPENKYMLEVTQGRTCENEQQLNKHVLPEEGDGNNQNTLYFSDKGGITTDERANVEKLHSPQKIIDKGDYIEYELLEPVTGAPQDSTLKSKSQREYEVDCHRCKYYKKLSELDKIIESLKIFETRLKNEAVLSSLSLDDNDNSKNFTDCPIFPISNPPVQNFKDDKCNRTDHREEVLALGLDIDESDFSKEDSDFIEFTHYLSKR